MLRLGGPCDCCGATTTSGSGWRNGPPARPGGTRTVLCNACAHHFREVQQERGDGGEPVLLAHVAARRAARRPRRRGGAARAAASMPPQRPPSARARKLPERPAGSESD